MLAKRGLRTRQVQPSHRIEHHSQTPSADSKVMVLPPPPSLSVLYAFVDGRTLRSIGKLCLHWTAGSVKESDLVWARLSLSLQQQGLVLNSCYSHACQTLSGNASCPGSSEQHHHHPKPAQRSKKMVVANTNNPNLESGPRCISWCCGFAPHTFPFRTAACN